ncbi:unnamed protein product [Ectocarpus sp. 6 AP-2014]
MSPKAKGAQGKHGGGGDGGGKSDGKKESSAKRCKKCTALLPMMYKMKDKLAELHPQCNQYKLELEALRAENQELRRQLAMRPSARMPAGLTATPVGSTNSSVPAAPVRQRALGSAATATTAAAGGGGGGGGRAAAAAAGASSKKGSKGAAVVAARPDAISEKRKMLAPSSGGTQVAGLTASLGLDRDAAGSGGGGNKGGGGRASDPAGSTAALTAPACKDRSKGEKVRDWAAAVARRKRERGGGGDGDENGKGAAGRGGGGRGGGGNGGGSTGDVGGVWGGLEKGGEDSVEEEDGEEEDKTEEAAGESGETVRKKHSSSSGGGDRKKGKGKKKKRGEASEAPAAVQPTGVFAAAAFSFLDEGSKEKGGGETTSSDDDDDDDDDSSSDDSDRSTIGRRQNPPRKRARTANGGAAATAAAGCGSSGGGGRRRRSGPVPQTSSMLARGFRPGGESAASIEDGVEGEVGGEGDFDDGWEEGEGQQEEEEVEWYEDTPGDMGRLGWSQVWRRGDVTAAAAGAGEGDEDGDGLDKGSRVLARKCRKLLLAAGSASSSESGDEILGPKGLSALLRLELTGAVSMEGVLVSALRGRSLKRDHWFLGRLALQLLSGIDAAHASPLSDPEVLSLVVEELEGLAEILAAPSTTEQLRVFGWARETRLALELLSETLLGWMDENQAKRSSGVGDAVNGDEENDDPGGYSSMSFGNSKKKKKKKAKAKGVGGGASAGSSTAKGGVREEGEGDAWRAEAEATVLWWWETDEEARVPWAVARLLGLLLRRLDQPQRTQAVLHPILVRSLGGPSRLRRFPLAFLEAFPGLFLRSSPTAAGALANGRHWEGQEEDGAKVDRGDGVLAPGLWRRAVAAVLFPQAAGGGVNSGGGAGGESAGVVGGGGGGGDGAAVVSARLKLLCFGDVRRGQQREGGGPEEETADDLADKILQAIGSLHSSPGAEAKAEEEGGCALCRGAGGGNYSGGACGGDDALAMSSGLVFVARGAKEEFPGELAVPRGRGESIAVEAVRALGLLGVGVESGGFPILRRLVPAIRRPGVCQRAAALACHVLAQCAAAGRGNSGGRVVRSARGLDMRAANAARALMDALRPDSEAEKWEAGQLDEDVKLPFGARAQAASALLSLLEGRYGESAAESERTIVEWAQRLKPEERLSAPLPLLLSITATLSRPPAHVINLARRPFRWKAVSDSARRQGVWLHRHEAVDWKAVEASSMSAKGWISDKEVALTWATELNTIYDKDCEKETTHVMHPSERACAASHLDLWRRHRDSKLAPFMPEVHPDAVLILEDDAKLEPGFLEAAKATMLQAAAMDTVRKKKSIGLSKEWDIIYLGHILPVPIMDGIARASKTKKNAANGNGGVEEGGAATDTATTTAGAPAGDTAAADAGADAAAAATALGLVVAPVTFAWGLHAYLLTRPAATRLSNSLPVSAPADIFVASMLTSTDSGRPVLAGRAVLPALATTAGCGGAGEAALAAALGGGGGADDDESVGDVVSTGTRRAGAANGVRLPPGMGPGAASRGRRGGGGGGGRGAP